MGDSYVLAGDLGGTNLRIAAVSEDGTVLRQISQPTPNTGAVSEIVDLIVRLAEGCIHAGAAPQPALAFGLALAALVNSRQGTVLSSPNLPQLNDGELSKVLSQRLKVKVVLENDATAAAIGEYWLGSSKGAESSVFVTLGTGVGGGLILDGRVYRGIDGTAGEIGHICVEPDGHACGCGSHGCVEQYASATAIVRITRGLLAETSGSSLEKVAGFGSKDVYDAATLGDAVALRAFNTMGRYLGIALADLVDVLNPELIVIGGGAAGAWDFFIEHVKSEIDARAFRHPARRVKLVRASLGETAGILGAARVAIDSLKRPSI
ncbi:MAG TPA: ROK family protein [Pyrinomonadaceae bacterium]|nr:ROK family protein [Pyrinomonadaceae bacterium]